MVPRVDVAPLLGPPCAARDAVDAAVRDAAAGAGFIVARGLPPGAPLDAATRARLLAVLALPDEATRPLWRRKFAPANPNVYRGWFPLQHGERTHKLGIDIGPDIARAGAVRADDLLREATPLPPEEALPGWRAAAAAYYLAMEAIGGALLRSVARGLGLAEGHLDPAFGDGISTLRLIRYPAREAASLAGIEGIAADGDRRGRHLVGAPHVDSGFVTLLAQDGVEGLQARTRDGAWIDVPPEEGTLAVNFGGVLERWTGGRIRATEHRVVGDGRARMSIPFFLEPAAEAVVAPLPLPGFPSFEPFAYGDHLWSAMMRFVEFRGLEAARLPRGARAA
ncbi:MAG: isopenicillin N synthase family oxygenase [Alphaproteobacteria bacterium]|nr:isopenicillin N synthase family oxygenase [Alphaproteobacteria bacterium]